jgi:FkbM family methyltransferase
MKDETRLLVDLRSNTEVDAYYRGEYDASEIAIIKKIINVNEAFLDIGAFIKSKKGIGKVYAFEPFADNYDRLVGNIALNNLEDYIQPMKIGLSDHAFDGEVILRDDFLDGASTGNTSLPINNQFDKGLFKKINSCKECEEIDNILIVPAEKGVYYD